ncbi:hypothetical protein BDN67DRAFT_228835 [Paxillus ammoniavirescens]|nr:hypothetical protein BDN67DRAFT_228835 [Paxillus ammoniavirescens]
MVRCAILPLTSPLSFSERRVFATYLPAGWLKMRLVTIATEPSSNTKVRHIDHSVLTTDAALHTCELVYRTYASSGVICNTDNVFGYRHSQSKSSFLHHFLESRWVIRSEHVPFVGTPRRPIRTLSPT